MVKTESQSCTWRTLCTSFCRSCSTVAPRMRPLRWLCNPLRLIAAWVLLSSLFGECPDGQGCHSKVPTSQTRA